MCVVCVFVCVWWCGVVVCVCLHTCGRVRLLKCCRLQCDSVSADIISTILYTSSGPFGDFLFLAFMTERAQLRRGDICTHLFWLLATLETLPILLRVLVVSSCTETSNKHYLIIKPCFTTVSGSSAIVGGRFVASTFVVFGLLFSRSSVCSTYTALSTDKLSGRTKCEKQNKTTA